MTINNPELFLAGIWDWNFLNECFEGKIKVSDIDGIVEWRGHFLVFETKQVGVPVKTGQRIMFERMAQTGLFTIVILWGKQNQTELMQIYYPYCIAPKPIKTATNEDVQRVAQWWSDRIDATKIVSFKDSDEAAYAISPANNGCQLNFNDSEVEDVCQIMTAGADYLIGAGKVEDLQLIVAWLQVKLQEVC